MRRMIPIMLLLLVVNFAKAQQKYYAFNFNEKYGITDTLGNEAIKPSYKYITIIPAKNQIYLQDFSEKPDIIFNTKTGTKQLFEKVYNNQLQIKGVPYSIINNKGKKYLLSEESDKTIAITRDYEDFYTVGNYIIAKYYAQDPYVAGGKDKNGKLLPPKIMEMKKHYIVLANDESLKTIVDKGFDKYLPLYKTPEEHKSDEIVRVETITLSLPIKESSPIFDYIILSKSSSHRLFNAKMVLVKAFVLAKADKEALWAYAQKLLKVKISTEPTSGNGFKSAPPMMVDPSMGTRKISKSEPTEKKPFEPYFNLKKLENGNTIFALQETEQISKHIFEANSKAKVELNKRKHTITISLDGKSESEFNFDPKTGAVYLPKAYLILLGIQITK